jgi:hypothetical protein
MAYISYLLVLGFNLQTLLASSWRASITTWAWSILIATGIYLLLQKPSVEIFDEGLRVHNPFTTITLGWQDVDVVEAKYSAFLQLNSGKKITIWSAQAPGRYHSRSVHSSEVKGLNLTSIIRPGESPRTDSGVVTYLCRTRLKSFRDAGRNDGLQYSVHRNKSLITLGILQVTLISALNIFHI